MNLYTFPLTTRAIRARIPLATKACFNVAISYTQQPIYIYIHIHILYTHTHSIYVHIQIHTGCPDWTLQSVIG